MNGKDILIVVLGALFLLSLFKINSDRDEYELYRGVAEKQRKEAIRSLEQQLLESRESRDSALRVIDSLNRDHKALRVADSLKIVELSHIPGRFNNKNSQELQQEMVKQYQQRQ